MSADKTVGGRTREEWGRLLLADSYHGRVLVGPEESLRALLDAAFSAEARVQEAEQKTATVAEHLGRVNRELGESRARVQRLEEALWDLLASHADYFPECECDESVGLTCVNCRARDALAAPDKEQGMSSKLTRRAYEQMIEKPEPPLGHEFEVFTIKPDGKDCCAVTWCGQPRSAHER